MGCQAYDLDLLLSERKQLLDQIDFVRLTDLAWVHEMRELCESIKPFHDPNNDMIVLGNIPWDRSRDQTALQITKQVNFTMKPPYCPPESKHLTFIEINHTPRQTKSGHTVMETEIVMPSKNLLSKIANLVEISEDESKRITHKIHKEVLEVIENASHSAKKAHFFRFRNNEKWLRIDLCLDDLQEGTFLYSVVQKSKQKLGMVKVFLNMYMLENSETTVHGDHKNGNHRTTAKFGSGEFFLTTSQNHSGKNKIVQLDASHSIKLMPGTKTALNNRRNGGNGIYHYGGNNSGQQACTFLFETEPGEIA